MPRVEESGDLLPAAPSEGVPPRPRRSGGQAPALALWHARRREEKAAQAAERIAAVRDRTVLPEPRAEVEGLQAQLGQLRSAPEAAASGGSLLPGGVGAEDALRQLEAELAAGTATPVGNEYPPVARQQPLHGAEFPPSPPPSPPRSPAFYMDTAPVGEPERQQTRSNAAPPVEYHGAAAMSTKDRVAILRARFSALQPPKPAVTTSNMGAAGLLGLRAGEGAMREAQAREEKRRRRSSGPGKRRRHKHHRGSSSSESSEEHSHGDEMFEEENEIAEMARVHPGKLWTNGLQSMRVRLPGIVEARPGNVAEILSAHPTLAQTYLATVFEPSLPTALTLRNARELQTVAESLDALGRGDLAHLGDLLMQRFCALQLVSTSGTWEVAQNLEVIRKRGCSSVPASMIAAAVRGESERIKMEERRLKVQKDQTKAAGAFVPAPWASAAQSANEEAPGKKRRGGR